MRGNREIIHPPPGHSFRVYRWHRNLQDVWVILGPDRAERIHGEGRHWHYHPEMELTLITSGSGTRYVGDHAGQFEAGDLVLLGERVPHYWNAPGASSGIGVQWNFPQGHPFWGFPETLPLTGLFQKAARGLSFGGHSAAVVSQGIRELACVYGSERLGLLMRLLSILSESPDSHRTFLSSRPFSLSDSTGSHAHKVADAVQHVLARFREPIRLADMLRLTGMGKTTFAEAFKKHSGSTFVSFVLRTRLHAAVRLLEETQQPVTDISLSCGFSQLSFFNRIFRRIYGCSPTEYRHRLHTDGIKANATGQKP